MTFESYVKSRLMDFVMEEAYAHGGVDPMLAVAQVLANRVKAGWSGGDWMGVIETARDYRGTVPANGAQPLNPRDGNFRELIRHIDDVYYGVADDSNVNNDSGKSLYYAELNNINREWFKDNILSDLESHPRLASVGPITFFG